jgi:amidase
MTTAALDRETAADSSKGAGLTAGALAAAIARGDLSAVEAVDGAIARIEAGDGPINAVVVRDFDAAREQARAADALLAKGERRPLLGVPMTVKESFDLKGHPTTWGMDPFRGHVAAQDALAVRRLKGAGAIVLGKTNVPTSLADWQSVNPIYGRTHNPLDPSRSPGGSSGGSAAALAAGYVPLELGSDIGGSIRVPAAFCGVYGHKPSYGLLPTAGHTPGGVEGAEPPLAVIGPLARSAADLATALKVLAGPDPSLGRAAPAELLPPRAERLADLRVLVLDEHPLTRTARDVRAAVNGLGDRLAAAGAAVERGAPLIPDLEADHAVFIRMLNTVITRGAPHAQPVSAHVWLADVDRVTAVRRRWAALFEDWDVVLAPAFPTVAYPHTDEPDWSRRTFDLDGEPAPYAGGLAWPGIAIFGGLPATAMPAGTSGGLPIGVQVIGPYGEDLTTIRVAELLGEG